MSSYISKSACRGRRPRFLHGCNSRKRPHLIARLLKERSVARFIVAPDGYGKTAVAAEYAETMFEWAHAFWFNCQSPCFIRDLDAMELSQKCFDIDSEARLVVFDDVPLLDAQRAQLLSGEIDALLLRSCEVIVTCSPSCDTFAGVQRDRLRLGPEDLLLTDEELDVTRTTDERLQFPASTMTAAQRVVMLVWEAGPNAHVEFLKSSFGQEMPDDLRLVMASMYVLGRGTAADVRRFVPAGAEELLGMLKAYPHFCYDEDAGEFAAPTHSVDDIGAALKRYLAGLVSASRYSAREELAFAWADCLLAQRGAVARACDVVRALCPVEQRPEWLRAHGFELIQRGCFYGAYRLVDSSRSAFSKIPGPTRVALAAIEAVSLHMLGDDDGAFKVAKRFGFGETSAMDAQICCLIVVARIGSDAMRDQAVFALYGLLEKAGHALESLSFYEWAAHALCASVDGDEALSAFWERQHAFGASAASMALTATWLFDTVNPGGPSDEADGASYASDGLEAAERFVRAALEDVDGIGEDFFAASAGLSLEQAHMRGMDYVAGPLPTPVLLALRNVEMSVVSQRRQRERDVRASNVRKRDWAQTHPSALGAVGASLLPAEQRAVPTLSVKLFGTFEVAIGGVPVSDKLLRRHNVCTLLALLTINQGHEMMRASLVKALWPNGEAEACTKNFYTVWSHLRRVLALPDGTCPYLIRHQYGCSMERRYLQSDTARFEEICRELLFGNPDLQEWPLLYNEIERDFSGDLMPGDTVNPLLVQARVDYRLRLIDALISASLNVVDVGNPQWGIWFARAAVNRDRTREDAYLALMRAQIAADQRTAAMMTYLKCQRILSEELGMDPSPELSRLYRSLLDAL